MVLVRVADLVAYYRRCGQVASVIRAPCGDCTNGGRSDACGRGDVAVGQTEAVGASDGLLVFLAGVTAAAGCALDTSQELTAELPASARLTDPLRFRDSSERHADSDRRCRGPHERLLELREVTAALLGALSLPLSLTSPRSCSSAI